MTASPVRSISSLAVCAALLGVFAARPYAPGTVPLMILFGTLLAVGVGWPTAPSSVAAQPIVVGTLAVGILAVSIGRVLGAGAPVHAPSYMAAMVLAAVAEEAFFRRFVYGVLAPGGTALAVGGSTVLFAVAHVTVYGWWVLPLDLAAGLVLSWQRSATGTWTVPAATHVIANLLIVL